MRKVLVVADTTGWAFDKIYRGLRFNCEDWLPDVLYLHNQRPVNFDEYDLILYLCDNFPEPLIHWVNKGLNKDKVLLAVRSDVKHPLYYRAELLDQVCKCMVCSNYKLFERFVQLHPMARVAEGGVDTDKFSFKQRTYDGKSGMRVGWAGNVGEWGRAFRGLDIIQDAVDYFGRWMKFTPALRDDKWRTEEEMVEYYHNDIDIYIEMSESAGRQNGLIEAGSCGVPCISYDCGIASDLFDGTNGELIKKRNKDDLIFSIKQVLGNYNDYSINIRETIEKRWSWKVHAKKFEKIFEEVLYD